MPNIYLTPNFLETQRQKGIMNSVLADFIGKNVPEVRSQVEQIKMKYGSDNDAAMKSFLDWKVYGTTSPVDRHVPETEQPEQTEVDFSDPGNAANRQFNPINKLVGGIGNKIQEAGAGVRRSLDDYNAGKQGALQTGIQTAAQIGSGIMSPATETIGAVAGGVMRATGADKVLGAGVNKLAQTKIGQTAIQEGTDLYEGAKEKFPQGMRTVETVGKAALDAVDIATVGFGKKAAANSIEAMAPRLDDLATAATAKRAVASAGKIDRIIQEGIEKGIRPSVRGKQTVGDVAKFNEQASTAVKSIVQRKDALTLMDEFGQEITEKLPQNLKQFSDAIDQTKRTIFQEYDSLAKEAGQAGAEVDLSQVANELIDAVSDPKFVSLEDQAPEIADYILKRAATLEKRGVYTAEQAQQAIKNYNQSLESFYRNPTYENYAKASIDSMIANNLRKATDDVISNATGGQYQQLKNQYASLKAIEKDTLNRALVDARKSSKGLLDFTDIFSGGDMIAGLLSANPTLIAKATAQKSIKEYFKFLNDPNRVIRSMFRKVDALSNVSQ